MQTAWIILLLFVNLIWLGMVLFTLPGNWLMVASTALFAWLHWDAGVFSAYTLGALVVLAVAAEVLEFLGGLGGARRAGARWAGAVAAIFGAFIGGIVGTFLIPVPIAGTLLGAGIGGAAATFLLEAGGGRGMDKAFRSGVGAGIGVFVGTVAKFAIGVVIYITIAVAALWP